MNPIGYPAMPRREMVSTLKEHNARVNDVKSGAPQKHRGITGDNRVFLNENFKLVCCCCCCCNSGELDFYIQPNIRHNNDVGVWPWNERKRDLSHSEVWQEFEEKRFKFEVSGEHGFSVSGTVAKVISYDISKIFKDPTRSNKFLGSDWSNQSFCSFHGFCVPPVPQLPWGWGCSPTINTPSRWAAIDAYWPGPLGFLLYWSWIPWCPNIQ